MKNFLMVLSFAFTFQISAQTTNGSQNSLLINGKVYLGDKTGILANEDFILQQPREKNLVIVRLLPPSKNQQDGQAVLFQDSTSKQWYTIDKNLPAKENEYRVITSANIVEEIFIWVHYKDQYGTVTSLMFPTPGGW